MITPASQAFVLHHVGMLVPDLTVAAAEFVARFGYQVESPAIEDPTQTAYVLFLRQPGTSFWLELVMPNGSDSKLKNALRKGGGLHHLCYEVEDMTQACASLRDQAMFMVAAPTPARAFPGRNIAWFMDRSGLLIELLECSEGPLSLSAIEAGEEKCV